MWLIVVMTNLCVAAALVQAMADCDFPDFMQTTGEFHSWKISYPEETYGATVKGGIMVSRSCTSQPRSCVEFKRVCVKQYGDYKFLVQQTLLGNIRHYLHSKYLCLQFVPRSKSVVQIRISRSNKAISTTMCSDDNLKLDNWPLVSLQHYYTGQASCPFNGGYTFNIFTATGSHLCQDTLLPLRIESDCVKGEGIIFTFPNDTCLNDLAAWTMDRSYPERLRCLASWKEGKHVFAIIKKEDGVRYWCMRVTFDRGDIKEIHIFFEAMCDPGPKITAKRYVILRDLKTHTVRNACTDEFHGCLVMPQFCRTDAKIYCRDSCDLCSRQDEMYNCSFPAALHGRWVVSNSHGLQNTQVRDKEIYLESRGTLQCVDFRKEGKFNRKVLLQRFWNGCYPRYTCFEFDRPTPSILRYRLGDTIVWPIRSYPPKHSDSYSHICDDSRFLLRSDNNQQSIIREPVTVNRPRHHLVNKDVHTPVSCNLPWYFGDVIYYTDALQHQGCLVHDLYTSPHKLFLRGIDNEAITLQRDYLCLGSLKFIGHKDIIITKSYGRQNEFLCWIFETRGHRKEIYVVPASECGRHSELGHHFRSEKPIMHLILHSDNTSCQFVIDSMLMRSERQKEATPLPVFGAGGGCSLAQTSGLLQLAVASMASIVTVYLGS
jgi:hypothetical protein